MGAHSIESLAAAVGGRAVGNRALQVDRPCHPAQAETARDLMLAMDPRLHELLAGAPARAAVLVGAVDWEALGLDAAIFMPHPRVAMAALTAHYARPPAGDTGVHPAAAVAADATIGAGVSIGPFVEIGPGAQLGDHTRILGSASVAAGASIGAHSLVYQGVRVGERVRIGARAILHMNATIGSDGFSFIPGDPDRVAAAMAGGATGDGREGITRIYSLGSVRIGDDVEIGAGSAIDRGTVADTAIGSGTKIDNLVHVGHNVQVGRDCLLCGQTGIAGSARIGDRSILGGQTGVGQYVEIGADCMIGGKSLVGRRVRAGTILVGWASLPRDEFHAVFRAVRRLARRTTD